MYSYEEVLEKIESGRRFGNLPGVEITRIMLEKLNHPQRELSFIHVAGTNGKGSVCAFLDSIMREARLKTGCFISPHLVDIRERFLIEGKMVEKEDFLRAFLKVYEKLPGDMYADAGYHPSFFEYLFFKYISEKIELGILKLSENVCPFQKIPYFIFHGR